MKPWLNDPQFTVRDFFLCLLFVGLVVLTILYAGHAREIDRLRTVVYKKGLL